MLCIAQRRGYEDRNINSLGEFSLKDTPLRGTRRAGNETCNVVEGGPEPSPATAKTGQPLCEANTQWKPIGACAVES